MKGEKNNTANRANVSRCLVDVWAFQNVLNYLCVRVCVSLYVCVTVCVYHYVCVSLYVCVLSLLLFFLILFLSLFHCLVFFRALPPCCLEHGVKTCLVQVDIDIYFLEIKIDIDFLEIKIDIDIREIKIDIDFLEARMLIVWQRRSGRVRRTPHHHGLPPVHRRGAEKCELDKSHCQQQVLNFLKVFCTFPWSSHIYFPLTGDINKACNLPSLLLTNFFFFF